MILIGIGANLSTDNGMQPLTTCKIAVRALEALPDLRLAALSPWYETAPMPPSGQPPYVNGVARLDGDADPAALLAALQAIEAEQGRTRSLPNAARTLDLDIIAIGDLVRTQPDPVLPHPRMHQRAFVLQPLLDVAPDWRHPAIGVTARALLAALPDQHVRVLCASHLRDGSARPN